MRAMLAIAFLLVLIIGLVLFIGTEQTEIYFAWTIPSFITAGFLGAAIRTFQARPITKIRRPADTLPRVVRRLRMLLAIRE